MMIGKKVTYFFALYLLGLAGTVEGVCNGNDSRCAGTSESACKQLDNSGADCNWVADSTTAASSNSFSCIKAGSEACPTVSNGCGVDFNLNSGTAIDDWLVADNGQPCTVIGGALTIQSKNVQAADLDKMTPLVAVCGSVTIQELATPTLTGLDNFEHIGGSFTFQNNARPWGGGADDVDDISALSSLKYIGGAVTFQQNYLLTESDITAGLNNVRIGGSVNFQFYDNPPTTAGATATATGSLQQCSTASASTSAAAMSTSVSTSMSSDTEPMPEGYSTSLESLEPAPMSDAMMTSGTTSTTDPESLEPAPMSDDMMTSGTTTSTGPRSGECVGNDSRCSGAGFDQCKGLENEGSDCRWVESADGSSSSAMSSGECTGNDSRCASSKQAKCLRLGNQGSDCTWTSAFKAAESSGACAGNDSRCPNKPESQCRSLGQEGADCRWRESFSASGKITMKVTNAAEFVNNAQAVEGVKDGISTVTSVPKQYIELDVYVNDQTGGRRLQSRALQAQGEVIITYVINVGADAPASVLVTSDTISQLMSSSNKDAINQAIVSKVEEAVGTNSYAITVEEAGVSVVVYVVPVEPEPDMTSGFAGGNLEDTDGALPFAAHPLLALIVSSFYFF